MGKTSEKYLIIRSDDINVGIDIEILSTISDILCIYPQNFGIIPYSKGSLKSIFENKLIFEFLGKFALEYALHGIFHERYLGNYEFMEHTLEREKIYRHYLNNCCGYLNNIRSFIPPNNALDRKWIPLLKEFNFDVISSTKREIANKYIKNVQYSKTGVIKKEGIFFIPQSLMIKKREFLMKKNYFDITLKKIWSYYKVNNLLVMTIHWWEFVGNKQEDVLFRRLYKQLLFNLKENNVEAISFHEAVKKGKSSYIETKHFEF